MSILVGGAVVIAFVSGRASPPSLKEMGQRRARTIGSLGEEFERAAQVRQGRAAHHPDAHNLSSDTSEVARSFRTRIALSMSCGPPGVSRNDSGGVSRISPAPHR